MFYDASGVRYLKQHYLNGSTIIHRYVTDEFRILSESIIGGEYAGVLDYVYLGNEVVGFGYKNKKYFYLKNLQGDIVKIYDENNTLFVEYEYDAWGNHTIKSNINSIGTINPFRYRGYYYDSETNLYYCQTRYYNPELCRWMSLDDIGYAEPSRLNGFNLYAYCGNNPVMCSDSSGCFAIYIFDQFGSIMFAAQRGHQGNMRQSKYRYLSDNQILALYEALCRKGRLTSKEKKELKDLEMELKARGLKNKSKRDGYGHSHFTNMQFLSNSYYIPPSVSSYQNNEFIIDWVIVRKVGGIALITAGILGGIYIIANDITIIGILDDIPGLGAAWAAITNGWQMIF